MDKDLKSLFKNIFITIFIVFIYGLIIWEKAIFIGMTLGGIISVLALFLLYKDAEFIVYSKQKPMKKTIIGYSKRYLLYGFFLFLMVYIDFQWFVAGALGLLIVKFNILLRMFSIHLKNIKSNIKN